ncbi:type I secretion system permease/ATPase [Dongia sp.]|uniref:type I secretion system permease/ATPase n=1 Tax=Dongia sp. TaxID=1977262 RepID=UPI0035B01797
MTVNQKPPRSPAAAALASARGAFLATAGFSGAINILMLSGSIFMLQVYDRVLASRSVPTLAALVVMIVLVYAFLGGLEMLRSRIFTRIGRSVDAKLADCAFDAYLERGAPGGAKTSPHSPFRDIEQLRGFLAGGGPSALFDLPWMPLYVFLLFGLHPWLGYIGLAGIVTLSSLTFFTDRFSVDHQRRASQKSGEATILAEASRRNAESILPLGMAGHLLDRWRKVAQEAALEQLASSDITSFFSSLSRFARMSLQSLVLALGAYLVISGESTGGVMIASSILLGRALAPVELAISNWKGFIGARQSYRRLQDELKAPTPSSMVFLPTPSQRLEIDKLTVAAEGLAEPILRDVGFALKAGDALGIIGPSGSGKSTLARALIGMWTPARGTVRLDGATLDQWTRVQAGRFLGYLPQQIELMAGTVAQNIARFDPTASSDEILRAAQLAGVDDLVRRLPQGFDTQVGEGGQRLSAGQRQRIALARALFRDPFLVVMDEPNSNLDVIGDEALGRAIASVRDRGGIVIVIAHRPSALAEVGLILALADGRAQAFGPKDEVLRQVLVQQKPKVVQAAE